MTRCIALAFAVLALLPAGAFAQIGGGPGGGGGSSSTPFISTLQSNNVCFVGDSITAATTTSDSITFNTTGGTPAYTMSVAGLPSGSVSTVSGNTIYITAAGAIVPGTYAITVSSTDSLAATGSQAYTYTISRGGLISVAPNGAAVGPLTVAVSAINITDGSRGPGFWVPFLTNRRFVANHNQNFATSGDTTTNVLARMGEILASPCGIYSVMIGTNDTNNASNPSLATVKANLSSIWSQLLATGRPVIAMTILPRELALPANQNRMDMLFALNAFIRAQTGTIKGLYVVDSGARYVNQTSATAVLCTGATVDYNCTGDSPGLHPKGVGAYYAWKPLADLLNQFVVPTGTGYGSESIADQFSAGNATGNLLPNGNMTFTGATGTVAGRMISAAGSTPDGWLGNTLDNGCAPCTFTGSSSAATLVDGSPAAQMVVGGTAQGGTQTTVLYRYSFGSIANFSAGDMLQATCNVEVDGGAAHVTAPFLHVTYAVSGVTYNLQSGADAPITPLAGDGGITAPYSGQIATPYPPPPLPSAPSTMAVIVGTAITNSQAGGVTVAETFRIGGCSLRKVT
jgi:hypothetical protein